jgi:hypothetical protein
MRFILGAVWANYDLSRENIEILVLESRLLPIIIPQAPGAQPVEATRFSTYITTKATAYLFLLSIAALILF